MSQAGSQAHAFYRDVAKAWKVWTVRDAGGYPAPKGATGVRAMPFWSTRSRAERIVANVPAYSEFKVVELDYDEFEKWLADLTEWGSLVGVNWSGPHAVGFDLEPDRVRTNIEICAKSNEA